VKGVRSYDCSAHHPECKGVVPVDIGGFAHLWCPECCTLTNLEAVSRKHEDYVEASLDKHKAIAYIAAKKEAQRG
jgi:hypothetical protein